jgi:hypothetical protein
MRSLQIGLRGLILSTGFFGAALGAFGRAIMLFQSAIAPDPWPMIQAVLLMITVGPLLGAAIRVPASWPHCRHGAYIGFFVWVALLLIIQIVGEFLIHLRSA